VWRFYVPFSAMGSNNFIDEKWMCRCIRGHVVPTSPSLQNWALRGSKPEYEGFLLLGFTQNFGPGPVPLRERVDSLRVGLLGLAFSYLCQSLFPNESTLVQCLGCARNAP
jgi:hypothetical protein